MEANALGIDQTMCYIIQPNEKCGHKNIIAGLKCKSDLK
jgi:hypothetical protein